MMKKLGIILIFTVTSFTSGYAQSSLLTGLVTKLQQHQQTSLQEKIFVHLDRTFYAAGETMWFRIYLTDGYLHQLTGLSQVAYLEVVNRNQQPVVQTKIAMTHGLGHGSVQLPPSLDSDNYTVRAYTRWMQNFSPEFYFHQTISIANVFARLPIKQKAVEPPPDIQFFPEGGQLVDGIRSKLAFRAVNAAGVGIDFTGWVMNTRGDTVAKFRPLVHGIGHFTFKPSVDESYLAVIKEPSGRITKTKLPLIEKKGFVIAITDTTQNRLKVTIKGKDPVNSSPFIYLIAHARQLVKIAVANHLVNGTVTFLIDKKDLSEGIHHFTVFDETLRPVAERLCFIKPSRQVKFDMKTDQAVVETRSKIILEIKAGGLNGQSAHASVSVFKHDSLQQIQQEKIDSYLWLTSDLKGGIESPDFYFSDDPKTAEALDNLMLTHGWSRFTWKEVLEPGEAERKFLPEARGHLMAAKILDAQSEKPVPGIPVFLAMPGKKIGMHAAYSNEEGTALFETHSISGTKKVIAQTGAHASNTHIQLISPFSQAFADRKLPGLNLSEKNKNALLQRSVSMQAEDVFHQGRNKIVETAADSTAFYGKAPEHYELDDYTRFPLMEEVMREYVKGVRVRKKDGRFIFKVLNAPENLVFENEPLVMIDGVPVFDTEKVMAMDPLKIKSVDVITHPYYFGKFMFEGVVSYRTYKADMGGYLLDPHTLTLNYEGLQANKIFFTPHYDLAEERNSRLPDQRNLLFWKPDITLDGSGTTIEFFSSDQTGLYLVTVQGLTDSGEPVFNTCRFEVKRPVDP
jgi:hypothetical protein